MRSPHSQTMPVAVAELAIGTRGDDVGFRTALDLESMLELLSI
jgi:hypothetical protein